MPGDFIELRSRKFGQEFRHPVAGRRPTRPAEHRGQKVRVKSEIFDLAARQDMQTSSSTRRTFVIREEVSVSDTQPGKRLWLRCEDRLHCLDTTRSSRLHDMAPRYRYRKYPAQPKLVVVSLHDDQEVRSQ
jgi:hypothetical protein